MWWDANVSRTYKPSWGRITSLNAQSSIILRANDSIFVILLCITSSSNIIYIRNYYYLFSNFITLKITIYWNVLHRITDNPRCTGQPREPVLSDARMRQKKRFLCQKLFPPSVIFISTWSPLLTQQMAAKELTKPFHLTVTDILPTLVNRLPD